MIADIHTLSPERLEKVTIHADRNVNSTLEVNANLTNNRTFVEGCSFFTILPDAQYIDLQYSKGLLAIRDLSGAVQLKTSNGSAKAKNHEGSVVADTSNR